MLAHLLRRQSRPWARILRDFGFVKRPSVLIALEVPFSLVLAYYPGKLKFSERVSGTVRASHRDRGPTGKVA